MNIFKKRGLKKELRQIAKREWELSRQLIIHDMPDEELGEFSKKYPCIYHALIVWAEELYELMVRQDEIFMLLDMTHLRRAGIPERETVEKSIWALKQAQECAE